MIGEDRCESGAVAYSTVRVERERGAVGVSDSFLCHVLASTRSDGAAATRHATASEAVEQQQRISKHCWKQSNGGVGPSGQRWELIGEPAQGVETG
jgi:hypothetical protein